MTVATRLSATLMPMHRGRPGVGHQVAVVDGVAGGCRTRRSRSTYAGSCCVVAFEASTVTVEAARR